MPDTSARDWTRPWAGGCLCGQIRLTVSAPPLIAMACHCTGCQRLTGSAYSLSAMFPSHGFAITQGQPVIGALHGPSRYLFCGHCKCWLFTKPEGMDDFVNLRPTMLDDAKWFSPYMETWTSEKLPWATTPAVHSFAGWPPREQFPSLLSGYAEHVKT